MIIDGVRVPMKPGDLILTSGWAWHGHVHPGGAPDAAQLQATVQALVGFGTRHSLSDTVSSKRGIGAARRWAQSRFEQFSRDCGGCGRAPTRQ